MSRCWLPRPLPIRINIFSNKVVQTIQMARLVWSATITPKIDALANL